ncbi:hypothetical protein Ciccas_005574 [Cichlidogyrus casuarinus]|uniref:Uncharacterized protein n=1 Tax=Cichlidogyrus casuarinus TaxID=1844966 RepID=A0ABD2Q897_9PLAT
MAYAENLTTIKNGLSGIEDMFLKYQKESSSELEPKQSRLKLQKERLSALKTKLLVSKDPLETLLTQIKNQSNTVPLKVDEHFSLTKQVSINHDDPNYKVDTSTHALAVEYRDVAKLIDKFQKQIDVELEQVSNQMGERSKVVHNADELSQWLIQAEKQLVRLNRVWVATRFDALRNAKAHVSNLVAISETNETKESSAEAEELDRETINGVDLSEAATRLYLLHKEATGPKSSLMMELEQEIQVKEENRSIKDQVIRLQTQLKRFIARLEKRQSICIAAKSFEKSRSYWARRTSSYKARVEAFRNMADAIDLSDYKLLLEEERLKKQDSEQEKPTSVKTGNRATGTTLREHKIQCRLLEEEITHLKEEINKWQYENEDTQVDDPSVKRTLDPKDLDSVSVSAGLIFVTNSYHEDTSSIKSVLQAEPFSFNVDSSKFMNECDKTLTKLAKHCSNEKLIEQADVLITRAQQACLVVEDMSLPNQDLVGSYVRLSRLANQLKTWQKELLPVGSLIGEEKVPLEVGKEQPSSEAVMLAQRLVEIRKAGARLVKVAPAKGPSVETLISRAAEQLLRHASRLGDISHAAEELSRMLLQREEALNETKKSLDEIETVSGLLPEVDHEEVLKSFLVIKDAKKIVAEDEDDKNMEKEEKQPTPDSMECLTELQQAEMEKLSQVDNEGEAKNRIQKLSKAEQQLISCKNEIYSRLQQITIQYFQAIKAFSSELRVYTPKNESVKPFPNVTSDTEKEAIFERWSRMEKRIRACKSSLSEMQSAWTFVNSSLLEITQWSEKIEQRSSEILTEFNASTPKNLVLSGVTRWTSENPGELISSYDSQFPFYEALLDNVSHRIQSDLTNRGLSKKQIEEASRKLDQTKISLDKIRERWKKELDKFEALREDLVLLKEKLILYANELESKRVAEDKEEKDEYKLFTSIQACLLQLEILASQMKKLRSAHEIVQQGPCVALRSGPKSEGITMAGMGREIESSERKIRSLEKRAKQMLKTTFRGIEKQCESSCSTLDHWLSASVSRLTWIMQEPEERTSIRTSQPKFNFRPDIDQQLLANRLLALDEFMSSFATGRELIDEAFTQTMKLKRTEHLMNLKPDDELVQRVSSPQLERSAVNALIESEIEKIDDSMDTINLNATEKVAETSQESRLPFLMRPTPKDALLLTIEARAKISKMDGLAQELKERFRSAEKACVQTKLVETDCESTFTGMLQANVTFLLETSQLQSSPLIDEDFIGKQLEISQQKLSLSLKFKDKISQEIAESGAVANKVRVCFSSLYDVLSNGERENSPEPVILEGSSLLKALSERVKFLCDWSRKLVIFFEQLLESLRLQK